MTKSTNTLTTTDGITLHYETHNHPSPSRPSLIFHHYYGGSPSTFAALLSQPALTGFHSILYHARGWAPSTGPPDPEGNAYSIERLSGDLAGIIAATCLGDTEGRGSGSEGESGNGSGSVSARGKAGGFVIIGHSMGAKVAQHYAATRPSPLLKGLILIAPAPLSGLQFPPDIKAQQLAAYKTAESVRFVLGNVLTAGPNSSSPLSEEIKEQCIYDSLRGNEWATAAWPAYACAENYAALEDKLDEIARTRNLPVLVLRGDKDFERHLLGDLGTRRGWENKTVPDCGHLIPLEKPRYLADEILGFVQRVE